MAFTTYRPAYPLSQYIDYLWSEIGTTTYEREKVLPNGRIGLMINLGAPHRIYADEHTSDFTFCQQPWINGLHTEYVVLEAVAETKMMGVHFRAGGAAPFFNFPIHELHNEIVDLDLVWGGFAGEVRERLLGSVSLADRFRLFEQLLLAHYHARFDGETNGWAAVQYAVQELTRTDRSISVRVLSDEIGMSQKHLIHQFKTLVGVPPKRFSRIARFNQVLQTVFPIQTVNWTEIAHHCHYYDQAHFNRDFHTFTGLTPTTYLELRNQFYGESLQANDLVNFVPIS